MMRRERGAIVSPDLKAHKIWGLRSVDVGIIPLIPSAHTSATVYVVAEKYAGLPGFLIMRKKKKK